jgi:para-nitrobenzyl esterase
MGKRRLLSAALAGLTGVALVTLPAQPSSAATKATASPPVVQTDNGAVQGVRLDRVDSFLGIPYAAPPVGSLRWAAPQPAAAWTGVKVADRFGNRCPALASTNGPRAETEDCLFVNVQRPAGLAQNAGRPVYVFIHGGGFVNGSSNQGDMRQIVQATGVIGVSMNYRLGVFGFLSVPGLASESPNSGDYGLLDQQAALRWVQRNIAAFGGDPTRVTIGGESAGAFSVCAHLVAQSSAGLFARAMLQSGACPTVTLAEAATTGGTIATKAGCGNTATAVACLRALSVAALLDAAGSSSWTPTRGTAFLPIDPRGAITTGQFAHVPVVVGSNRDEGRTFAQGDIGWTQEQYVAWVRQSFGTNADAVLAHYQWPANADKFTPAYLVGAIQTDSGMVAGIGGCSNRKLVQDFATHVPTWAYEFSPRRGPGLTPIPGYVWGAGHAAELAYLFPSFNNGTPIAPTFTAGQRELAQWMKRYWGAFVRRGNPNVADQTYWSRYDTTKRWLSLRPSDNTILITDSAYRAAHQCAFWDALPMTSS